MHAGAVKEPVEYKEQTRVLKLLLDSSPDGIAHMDAEGRYLYVNKTMQRLSGVPADRMLGKTPAEAGIPQDMADMLMEGLRGAGETKREKWFDMRAGTTVFQSFLVPELDTAGNAVSFQWFVRDITESKQTEETLLKREERLRFALEGANDSIWDVDLRTNEFYLSPRGCEMLGFSPDEINGVAKTWKDLVHPADIEHTLKRLDEFVRGREQLFVLEQRLRMKSGGMEMGAGPREGREV